MEDEGAAVSVILGMICRFWIVVGGGDGRSFVMVRQWRKLHVSSGDKMLMRRRCVDVRWLRRCGGACAALHAKENEGAGNSSRGGALNASASYRFNLGFYASRKKHWLMEDEGAAVSVILGMICRFWIVVGGGDGRSFVMVRQWRKLHVSRLVMKEIAMRFRVVEALWWSVLRRVLAFGLRDDEVGGGLRLLMVLAGQSMEFKISNN
ncbi:hypothetical protein LR48_Vigan05g138600 [Vigna angularis]|uniref:Uncharacterized protein n=1 Tax=Phaseolus angularis TaxID=3914 RepID=A0A0L9UM42_PHAAN|nr:hypothetical protein LR48_Vigan05g138600 [Vigna angularis]